ncbi:DNA-directed RNA polymerase II subunit RPB1-like [Bombus pascuorum]|uniref:DNA-directed RNA polymerase II subunit RPB1-like n=1 Tax=Bombus pascuorum TaxID=65598 RepID=UPI00298EAA2D|nr:DNA-directed RNA polymerase II subunit RPB1-like [Bombus pascuorum]
MDNEKYYDKKSDGSYVIHFLNKKGLDLQEVNKRFSVFGKVLSVNNHGKANALCFIKYETVEDAIKCIDGFKNNKSIKILPHIHKINSTNEKRLNRINNRKKISHSKNKKISDQDSSRCHSEKSNLISNFLPTKQFQDTQTDCQSDSNISKSLSNNNNFNNDEVGDKDSVDPHPPKQISSSKHISKFVDLHRIASNSLISSGVTDGNVKELKNIFDETEIPALMPIDKKYGIQNGKAIPSSAKIIPAKEVIVANINPSLSVHYILHLFKKFNPIAVSSMILIPKIGISYCHVYYETYNEAYASMEEFDMYHLHGRKLIVLTTKELMKQISLL